VALVAGVLVVGGVLAQAFPREVGLRFDLGEEHREVVEAHITYLLDADEMASLTLRHPEGFPRHFRHSVELAPGRYTIAATLVDQAGTGRPLERGLEVPVDGLVQVRLYEDGP
jgi:hypothetical protein